MHRTRFLRSATFFVGAVRYTYRLVALAYVSFSRLQRSFVQSIRLQLPHAMAEELVETEQHRYRLSQVNDLHTNLRLISFLADACRPPNYATYPYVHCQHLELTREYRSLSLLSDRQFD